MSDQNFNPFPILTTEQLTLRQLSIDDQQHIFALRSDTEINKYLGREPCKTIEDAIHFITKVNLNIKNNNSCYWAITLTKTNTFVGTICLYNFSNETNTCEIGYELLTHFQGQGIMIEAAGKVIDHAFLTLQFQKIVAFSHMENQHSNKLLSKLGFHLSKQADKENPGINIYSLYYHN